MEIVANATESAIALIIQNLCNQVLEFQNAIAAREPGHRAPDTAEAGAFVKLVNCLVRLSKLIAPPKSAGDSKAFLRHLKNTDQHLASLVARKYDEFLAGGATPPMPAPAVEVPTHWAAAPQAGPAAAPSVEEPEDAPEYYCPEEIEKAPVPDLSDDELLEPIHIPMPAELAARPEPKDPGEPRFIEGEFDALITRQQLDKYPIALDDYNGYWELVNQECTQLDEMLIHSGFYKLHVLQYKLRYIHYLLELAAWRKKQE